MRSANGSLEFLRRISRHRRSAQRVVKSISEYVEQCASLLTPEHVDEVRGEFANPECSIRRHFGAAIPTPPATVKAAK
jgi:hypothetical protein